MPLRTIYSGPMPPGMRTVLLLAKYGFTVSSNGARHYAREVSIAASNGWITVVKDSAAYTNAWSITTSGLTMLENLLHEQTPTLNARR